MSSSKMQSLGLLVLRLGIAAVFIWFGYQQIFHPDNWVGMVPEWAMVFSLTAKQLVLINGSLEIIGAILLILNLFTRIVALLLAIHLLGIALSFGLKPNGVRDFGLAVATFSIFLFGPRI